MCREAGRAGEDGGWGCGIPEVQTDARVEVQPPLDQWQWVPVMSVSCERISEVDEEESEVVSSPPASTPASAPASGSSSSSSMPSSAPQSMSPPVSLDEEGDATLADLSTVSSFTEETRSEGADWEHQVPKDDPAVQHSGGEDPGDLQRCYSHPTADHSRYQHSVELPRREDHKVASNPTVCTGVDKVDVVGPAGGLAPSRASLYGTPRPQASASRAPVGYVDTMGHTLGTADDVWLEAVALGCALADAVNQLCILAHTSRAPKLAPDLAHRPLNERQVLHF